MDEISRWFLAAFFLSVAAAYCVRILRVRAQTGRSPVIKGDPGSQNRLLMTIFRLFRAAILIVTVARIPWPELDQLLGPVSFLQHGLIQAAGCLLLLAGAGLAVAGHRSLGADWRSGVDHQAKGRLHIDGLFAWSRNPMMIGVQLGQLGFLLACPNMFSLLCLLIGVMTVHGSVRLEEAYLQARFGPAYAAYAARTPRWFRRPHLLPAAQARRRA